MNNLSFADILLIILICVLIWAILRLTNRKQKSAVATKEKPGTPVEENQSKTTEDD